MNDNKNYVIVSHSHGTNRATYYAGCDGSYVFSGRVLDAVRFSWKELTEMFADPTSLITSGVTIVRIEDCTFEKLEHDEALRETYNDFLYVAT